MPCNSDYLAANDTEIELGRVFLLLDELKGKNLTDKLWNSAGYDKRVYNKADKSTLNKKVTELCSKLQKVKNITEYSLEMQMWWRDHKAADKERVKKEQTAFKEAEIRKRALAKLSEIERRALGLP